MSRKRKKKLPMWTHGPLYLALRSMLSAMMTGDLAANIRTAKLIGRTVARAPFNRRRLARAVENLAVAFPDWSDEKRREHAVIAYEHLFTLVTETVYTPRMISDDGWGDHLRLGNLDESVRYLLREQPCLLITGHCGNWELLGYILAVLGFDMHAVYRPIDFKAMDRWLRQTRERRGLILIDKFGTARELPRLMKRGAPVGFVADQNAGDRGLFVPFFDRLASSYKAIGLAAIRADAPIICGQARRLVWERDGAGEADEDRVRRGRDLGFAEWSGEPFRYRVDVVDVIHPDEWIGQPDPLFYVTARYRRAIETMVRRAPEQYLWMHRYWKSRPRHERQGRPMPPQLREKIEQLPWMTPESLARIEAWSERDARMIAKREDRESRTEPGVGMALQ